MSKSEDLHGNVPDTAATALLLIDVINDLAFPGGDDLLVSALPLARNLSALKARTRAAKIPAIYVNDNFGRWRSDFKKLVNHCRTDGALGKPAVELLLPDDEDYFVLKPKHSGFYSTSLDLLLKHLGATNLILTGIAGNNCVLFTANDAYLRDYRLFIPSDCVVSETEDANLAALEQMRSVLKADITESGSLDLSRLTING